VPTFDRSRFENLRRMRKFVLGAPLSTLDETTSTSDLALKAADSGAPHGSLFVAEVQTKGRGRHGHTWTSPAGENLTFSILLRPEIDAARANGLALVVGLAVRAAAAARVPGAKIAIKWPNDVVAPRRKLAGILVESRLKGSLLDAVVVGVGLNVGMRSMPDEIAAVATSLALLGDAAPNREEVLADILAELEPRFDSFVGQGLRPLLSELRKHDALLGTRVVAGGVRGVASGIDADGALLVEDDGGRVERITSGSVERDPDSQT
jgi:BirA family transcriptional regulator, biotin operon repressor / biotin---[acetyl-CoA-carboxylase] ligase